MPVSYHVGDGRRRLRQRRRARGASRASRDDAGTVPQPAPVVQACLKTSVRCRNFSGRGKLCGPSEFAMFGQINAIRKNVQPIFHLAAVHNHAWPRSKLESLLDNHDDYDAGFSSVRLFSSRRAAALLDAARRLYPQQGRADADSGFARPGCRSYFLYLLMSSWRPLVEPSCRNL